MEPREAFPMEIQRLINGVQPVVSYLTLVSDLDLILDTDTDFSISYIHEIWILCQKCQYVTLDTLPICHEVVKE